MRLFFALILLSTVAVAQDSDRFDRAVPRHAIKFSPGHLLINHHPTIEFSYEHRIAHRLTVQGEYGHIVNTRHESSKGRYDHAWKSDRKGYKAKVEARYYVSSTKHGEFTGYTAGELYYNNVNYLKQIDIRYEGVSQRVYHEEKGISGKFGFLWNVGPLLLDINGGLCYRFIHYSKLLPAFANDESGFIKTSINDEKSRDEPGFVLGMRVGYRFPWRRPA